VGVLFGVLVVVGRVGRAWFWEGGNGPWDTGMGVAVEGPSTTVANLY